MPLERPFDKVFVNNVHELLANDLNVGPILTYLITVMPSLKVELTRRQFEGAETVFFDLCSGWLFHLNMRLTKELKELNAAYLKNFHEFFKLSDTGKALIVEKVRKFSEKMPEQVNIEELRHTISLPILNVLDSVLRKQISSKPRDGDAEKPFSFKDISERFRNDQDMASKRIFVDGVVGSDFFDEAYRLYKEMYLRYNYQQTILAVIETENIVLFKELLSACSNADDLFIPVDGVSSPIALKIAESKLEFVDTFSKYLIEKRLGERLLLLDNKFLSTSQKFLSIWFEAAGSNNIDVLDFCLALDISIDALNNTGKTALGVAAARGKMESINYLTVRGASIKKVEGAQFSLLHEALKNENPVPVLLRLLALNAEIVDEKNLNEMSALSVAARDGKEDAVTLLLLFSANPNCVDGSGNSALHYAAQKGYEGICMQLLNAGAVSEPNRENKTPAKLAQEAAFKNLAKEIERKTAHQKNNADHAAESKAFGLKDAFREMQKTLQDLQRENRRLRHQNKGFKESSISNRTVDLSTLENGNMLGSNNNSFFVNKPLPACPPQSSQPPQVPPFPSQLPPSPQLSQLPSSSQPPQLVPFPYQPPMQPSQPLFPQQSPLSPPLPRSSMGQQPIQLTPYPYQSPQSAQGSPYPSPLPQLPPFPGIENTPNTMPLSQGYELRYGKK